MWRAWKSTRSNITNKSLPDLFNEYADEFKIIFEVWPFHNDQFIDAECGSTFTGIRHDGNESNYHKFVVLLHQTQTEQNLFAPLYIIAGDGSTKACFSFNDETTLNTIVEFVNDWNCKRKFAKISKFLINILIC